MPVRDPVTDAEAAAVLQQPLYAVAEAARLLGVPERTLRRWLGGDRGGGPVVGDDPRHPRPVVWGEFVEAAFVRRYRARSVSMAQLRRLITSLREQFGVAYPLASFRPFVGENHELLMELQEEAGVFMVVTRPRGQLVLTPPVVEFLDTLEFDQRLGVARGLRPWGPGSAVRIRPDVAFGLPAVRGVRTEVLAAAVRAGDPPGQVAEAYGLTPAEVDEACRWESTLPRRRRA